MKKIILILFLQALFTNVSNAQKLISSLSELYKINEYEAKFINKPLSILLGEIQPSIIRVIGSPSSQNNSSSAFMMYFITDEEKNKLEAKGIKPIHLFIIIKEDFKWNVKERYNNNKRNWSIEDLQNYGHLTVTSVDVIGELY
ncbi:MAG: hypothetical protein RLZZ546_1146 [Bacteroidota bacterium]|jgi:hypothetical protein